MNPLDYSTKHDFRFIANYLISNGALVNPNNGQCNHFIQQSLHYIMLFEMEA